MDEFNTIVNIVKESLPLVQSSIPSIVGGFITAMFLRGNTSRSEFEKIKAGKIKEAIDSLVDSRELSLVELVKCKNLLKIAEIADAEYVKQGVSESEGHQSIDFDWFLRFFEEFGNISDEQRQILCARILVGKMNSPTTFSRSLIQTLSIIEPKELELFNNISRFAMVDYDSSQEQYHPFIFISKGVVAYADSGITRDFLLDLQQLGLIKCDFNNEYVFLGTKKFRIGNKLVHITGDKENEEKILVGNVVFSNNGKALYSIIDKEYKEYRTDILEYTVTRLKIRNCSVEINGRVV